MSTGPRTSPYRLFGLFAAIGVGAVFAWLRWGAHWPLLYAWLIAINAGTLAAYAYDKAAAGRQALRIPEIVLHTLALLGGTPAAFLGQVWLRHKSRKQTFQWRFWLIVLIQAIALTWYLAKYA